jgi:hypothetical protein
MLEEDASMLGLQLLPKQRAFVTPLVLTGLSRYMPLEVTHRPRAGALHLPLVALHLVRLCVNTMHRPAA